MEDGRVQRECEVVHLIAQTVKDLIAELAGVSGREENFPVAQEKVSIGAQN